MRLLRSTLILIILFAAGCSRAGSDDAAVDKSKWKMVLVVEQKPVDLPLEVMYVHLTDNDAYPESFEIKGPSVYLVGEFPMSVRIGYGEDWSQMLNKQIKIVNRVRPEYYWIEGDSTITLPGKPQRFISSGTLTIKKVTGSKAGLKGDMTLHGDITLNISVGDEILPVRGTFAIHGVSLG